MSTTKDHETNKSAATSTVGLAPPLPPPPKRSKTSSVSASASITTTAPATATTTDTSTATSIMTAGTTASTTTSSITTTTSNTTRTTSSSTHAGRRTAVLDLTSILQAAKEDKNNNDNVEDDEVVADEEVDNDPMQYKLVKPGVKCTAACWEYFMMYCNKHHPTLTNHAQCMLCPTQISRGAQKSTGGLIRHLQFKHFEQYCFMVQKEAAAKEAAANQVKNGMGVITAHFRSKDKFSDAEAKQLYLVASSTCAATHGLPLSLFEKPAFRKMFTAVSKTAHKIVNITSQSLRTEILTLGMMASVATHKELVGKRVSYTMKPTQLLLHTTSPTRIGR